MKVPEGFSIWLLLTGTNALHVASGVNVFPDLTEMVKPVFKGIEAFQLTVVGPLYDPKENTLEVNVPEEA